MFEAADVGPLAPSLLRFQFLVFFMDLSLGQGVVIPRVPIGRWLVFPRGHDFRRAIGPFTGFVRSMILSVQNYFSVQDVADVWSA